MGGGEPALGRKALGFREKLRRDLWADGSGHDDFVGEAACGNGQQEGAHGEEGEAVKPEMLQTRAAENYAAGNVDEIAGGNQVADGVEDGGHGFSRKDVTGKENAGEDGEEGCLLYTSRCV